MIFADRGGEEFALDDGERETMLTLGRLAALTASVEHSTEQRESERRLAERVELTRELHENAIQRLFGVALALGSERGLSAEERRRCQEELRSVVGDLRHALTRPVGPPARGRPRPASTRCSTRLLERRPELALRVGGGGRGAARPRAARPVGPRRGAAQRRPPRRAEPDRDPRRLRRRDLHASRSRTTAPATARTTSGGGLGLRLAALEALRYEGLVEFGVAPARAAGASASSSPVASPDGAEDGKLRVLVVDDHDVVQWGFRLLLERQSWVERCLAASDGAEAVEVCRKLQPEVALVDMLLGSESGAEVCEEIRAVSPSTRVLLISGAGVISPIVARSAGASGFISKDWSAVDVVKAVRMVSLGHRGLRRRTRRSTRRSPSASRRCSR